MTQQIQTTLKINGIANGSPYTTQQPTLVFNNLPFNVWGSMSSARTVTGKVVGIANPQQYQVALFASESKTQLLGKTAWLVDVGSDGSFSVSVQQSATMYCALLMTPSFAQSYFASAFPSGSGTVSSLPQPADNPGDVLLMISLPAGINRDLVIPFGSNTIVKPGDAYLQPSGLDGQMVPPSSTKNMPDPTNTNDKYQMWNWMLGGPNGSIMPFHITTQNPDGSAGKGAFAVALYVYGNNMYVLAGAGAVNGGSAAPVIVSQSIVNWQVLAPSMVQVGMALTLMPEKVVLAIDLINVEQSSIATFLKAFYKVELTLLGLLFAEL